MSATLDNLQIQLFWDRLLALVEEQAQTLMRTAFSPVVREAGDLSAGVFSPAGDMLAQAVTGTPGHVNAMAQSVGHFIEAYPVAELKPGDVLVTNDPWLGTGHLNDFTVVTPVFLESKVVALFAATSHIADVGGRGFGPDAGDVFEEGLRIPIQYLFRAGELNETLMNLLLANVRDPGAAEGDLYSLTACNHQGSKSLVATMEEFGISSLGEFGAEIILRSRSAMEKEIEKLPVGSYHHAFTIDGYDQPVELKLTLTIEDTAIHLDFGGSATMSSYGINVPLAYTQAYASFGVRCIVGGDIPNNAGSLSPVKVTALAGTLLNAPFPAAVSARHAIGQMLPDLVLGCLHQVVPERVPAEGASCIWNPVLMSAQNAREPFVINPIFNGGTGARSGKDGLSTTAFPSGVRTTSVEVNELTSPLVILRKEYRENSGGAGEYRGGLGQCIEIGHRTQEAFVISKMFERIKHPALGRSGGEAGACGRVYLSDGTSLAGKSKDTVAEGLSLILETPGGGGIGKPEHRDTARVAADRDAGLISPLDRH